MYASAWMTFWPQGPLMDCENFKLSWLVLMRASASLIDRHFLSEQLLIPSRFLLLKLKFINYVLNSSRLPWERGPKSYYAPLNVRLLGDLICNKTIYIMACHVPSHVWWKRENLSFMSGSDNRKQESSQHRESEEWKPNKGQ